MPPNVPRLSIRLLWVCAALALGTGAIVALQKAQDHFARGWGQYREPAPAGAEEARIRQLVLSDQPAETRFAGLFEYFAAGFVRHATPGFARVQYAGAGSRNGYALDGLEGFARTAPLLAAWVYSGRSPLLSGTGAGAGGPLNIIEMLRSGIIKGANPRSPDYWGNILPQDQRIVEAADVARVLWLTRGAIWSRLGESDRANVRTWLLAAGSRSTPHTNWMLFPVVINLVLASLEGARERSILAERAHSVFSQYKQLYLDHGWFNDPPHGADFYNPWGITYDLFWIHAVDPTFEPNLIVTALGQSAALTQYLVGPRGVPILGRSICYRTAVPVPLIAATLTAPDLFPAGKALRGLDTVWRYFIDHDSLREGALTQGYFKADLRFLDLYSGSGSCHWGLRSLVLAFMHPTRDAFWRASEEPLPIELADYRLELARFGWGRGRAACERRYHHHGAEEPAGREHHR
jgi:hypothetical protein